MSVWGFTLADVSKQRYKDPSPEEEFVRACLERALGVPVTHHDDNSEPSMYDLEINYVDRPAAPVEVTSDANRKAMGTLKSLPKYDDGFWSAPTLQNSWLLHTHKTPPLKPLYAQAEKTLATLERLGISDFEDWHVEKWERQRDRKTPGADQAAEAGQLLRKCGIIRASATPAGSNGAVIALAIELGGGAWTGSGESIVPWIESFTSDPTCSDNIRKLAGAGEAHLAVYAHMNSVPYPVWRALEDHRDAGVLPTTAPNLTSPITHVWLFPVPQASTGVAWAPDRGWFRFPLTPQIPDPGNADTTA